MAAASSIIGGANNNGVTPCAETPFSSIETSCDYLDLLLEAIESSREEVEAAVQSLSGEQTVRSEQALRLASLKLGQLSSHITISRRLLHDLRRIRSLLV
jgi:hypothetical protein